MQLIFEKTEVIGNVEIPVQWLSRKLATIQL